MNDHDLFLGGQDRDRLAALLQDARAAGETPTLIVTTLAVRQRLLAVARYARPVGKGSPGWGRSNDDGLVRRKLRVSYDGIAITHAGIEGYPETIQLVCKSGHTFVDHNGADLQVAHPDEVHALARALDWVDDDHG